MVEEIHSTQTERKSENWFLDNTKKALPTLLFGALVAVGSAFWGGQQSQRDLAAQTETNRQASITNAANIAKNAENYNQLIIAFTKISENQIRMAQDISGIQDRERQRLERDASRR